MRLHALSPSNSCLVFQFSIFFKVSYHKELLLSIKNFRMINFSLDNQAKIMLQFKKVIMICGAVVQLGERSLRMAEVAGSNPVCSIQIRLNMFFPH